MTVHLVKVEFEWKGSSTGETCQQETLVSEPFLKSVENRATSSWSWELIGEKRFFRTLFVFKLNSRCRNLWTIPCSAAGDRVVSKKYESKGWTSFLLSEFMVLRTLQKSKLLQEFENFTDQTYVLRAKTEFSGEVLIWIRKLQWLKVTLSPRRSSKRLYRISRTCCSGIIHHIMEWDECRSC